MKAIHLFRISATLSLLAVVLLFAGTDWVRTATGPSAQAVFYVAWYDVGKAALDGLKGVKRVESGWQNAREINTVTYDPSVITVRQLESILKQAGTYRGTAHQ